MIAKGASVSVVGYAHEERNTQLRAERITIGKMVLELR